MNLELRKATLNDCKLIFDWANDKDVRNNAINQNAITWEDHCTWFSKILFSPDSSIFILTINKMPAGQIRLDKNAKGWFITYSVDKAQRGKGIGKMLITKGIEHVPNGDIFALVRCENIASIKVFERLGFDKLKEEKSGTDCFITYIKRK